MKKINLLSLVQAYSSLEEDIFNSFLSLYDIEVKNEEVDDLTSLVDILYTKSNSVKIFDQFYVGYKIPQIGKEFDLLRLGEDFVINIELKKISTEEKVQKQLNRNQYYLSYLGKKIHNFSFISETKQLFFLNDRNIIEEVDFPYLLNLLESSENCNTPNIDGLFNPSDYLVSPFNSTDKFIEDGYFLTPQQEEIKKSILHTINHNPTAAFASISGSAGTGKTLLMYDIAKKIRAFNKKVLIIHCGYLNDGQNKLNDDHGWNIIPIKNHNRHTLSDYDVVIIDEAQRIYPNQLEYIVNVIRHCNGKCLFSYDKSQTLHTKEEQWNIEQQINGIESISTYNLTERIRTNKEIASFIKALFNKKRNNIKLINSGNIELNYFDNNDDAKSFLRSLNDQEWKVLRFTPSQYNNEHHEEYSDTSHETSHGVIGQEFDSVVVVIDRFFSYRQEGSLIYRGGSYYYPAKMLFQNITRTRKRLNIVIINNSELLDRCVSILQG